MSVIRSAGAEGKVAQILSPTEVAINIGWQDGVRVGDVFAVLAANALPIVDPDTGEELGKRTLEKARVTIREVQERFSVGLAESRLPTYVGSLGQLWVDAGGVVPNGAEVATLPDEDRYVKRGDQVRLVEAAPEPQGVSRLGLALFLPALERAIKKVGGTYNQHFFNQSYVHADRWDAFLVTLVKELGSDWAVTRLPNGNYISAEYIGPAALYKQMPVVFQPKYTEVDGVKAVSPQFELGTL